MAWGAGVRPGGMESGVPVLALRLRADRQRPAAGLSDVPGKGVARAPLALARRVSAVIRSPSRAPGRRFCESMDEIGVWGWGARYEPGKRFEPVSVVRDGTHWSLTLACAGRQVESSGDTAGPQSRDLDESRDFGRFCEAISRLLGSREFA